MNPLPDFNNNQPVFAEFIKQHQPLVFNTALGIVQNHEDAEEIAQDVFIEVYRQYKNFKGDSTVSTWLYRITANKCIDLMRKKKSKKRFAFITSLFSPVSNEPVTDAAHFVHPGVQAENKEKAAYLFKAIEQLPENQKTAYVLCEIEMLRYKEIAEVMQVSVASVEALIFRARQNLRKILEKSYKNL
ncbi:MAG: RNA polymerase sigma factor [Chitinophagaceae bacterium]|nr:RNA polymerase sigma factor [Chitinophagaceae bacterium]